MELEEKQDNNTWSNSVDHENVLHEARSIHILISCLYLSGLCIFVIVKLISGQICLLKDPVLAQFTGADVTHITSPRIAFDVKPFLKIDLSNVPQAYGGILGHLALGLLEASE